MKSSLCSIRRALPSLSKEVTILRPAQGTYENGRWIKQPEEVLKIQASVQTAGDKDLEDVDEGRRVNGGIKMYSDTLLQTASVDGSRQPDVVKWKGDKFMIETVSDWEEDGSYFKALATRIGQ